jgi:hypothetical protein
MLYPAELRGHRPWMFFGEFSAQRGETYVSRRFAAIMEGRGRQPFAWTTGWL